MTTTTNQPEQQYTPTSETVRADWSHGQTLKPFYDPEHEFEIRAAGEAFDRWLAEVRADEWDEAHAAFNAHFSIMGGGPANPHRPTGENE